MLQLVNRQPATEIATGMSDGAMPAVEIGLDAGPTSPSAIQFKGGAAVGTSPTMIVEMDLNPEVSGVLARISPDLTLKQTAPGEGAAKALDAGPAQDTILFFGSSAKPLPDYIRSEIAA